MRKFLNFFSKIQSVSRLSQLANRSVANAITYLKTDNQKLIFQEKRGRTPFKQKYNQYVTSFATHASRACSSLGALFILKPCTIHTRLANLHYFKFKKKKTAVKGGKNGSLQ